MTVVPVQRDCVTTYVALGANLGNASAALRQAMDALDTLPGVNVLRRSSLYRSAPVESSGPDYVNAVVQISTTLSAPELLLQLQAMEVAAGRERPYPNAPRTLDLDILTYGHARIESAQLTLPHPRMMQRAFVLLPLGEIAPELVSAAARRSIADQPIKRI